MERRCSGFLTLAALVGCRKLFLCRYNITIFDQLYTGTQRKSFWDSSQNKLPRHDLLNLLSSVILRPITTMLQNWIILYDGCAKKIVIVFSRNKHEWQLRGRGLPINSELSSYVLHSSVDHPSNQSKIHSRRGAGKRAFSVHLMSWTDKISTLQLEPQDHGPF